MIAFGPVPSRRLGRSLGINNIPPKRCSYACVYCQLGRTTKMQVKRLELLIGVITNASLLWRQDVRDDLLGADWISLKVDAVDHDCWRRVNRPHRGVEPAWILKGVLEFPSNYDGQLVTETMLVAGANDQERSLGMVA